MVIKTFTFIPDDPAFAGARPGSPHPYFKTIISGSSSGDIYCTNFIRGLTSIYNSRILSSLVPDKRLRAGAEAGDNNSLQILANPTEQRCKDKEGLLANVRALWKRLQKRRNPERPYDKAPDDQEGHLGQIIQRFSLSELQVATENFSPNNILGRGAFGKVYKGRLSDGSLVAVKRMKEMCSEAEVSQFHKELLMVGIALHRNLLRLRGFCIESEEQLLVYPLMANGNLASKLRATRCRDSEPKLDWSTRKRIALGVARGLAYLHEHCSPMIIHRDVKAENILLNEDFEAVICDFGIAKFMDYGDNHAFTGVCGTVGHIAPEYISMGSVSAKTDVYGYGVMLLELISGQRGCDLARLAFDDGVMFHDWVKGILKERKLDLLVHKAMPRNDAGVEVEQLSQVALLCIQVDAAERPTMSSVVGMLEGKGLLEKWQQWQENEMLQEPVPVDTNPSREICEVRLEYIHRDAFKRLSAWIASLVVLLISCKTFYMLCQVYHFLQETFVIYTLWLYNATIPLLPLGFQPHWSKFLDPSLHIKRFSINELRAATMNFNSENIIGEGRFGIVYKGRLADGSLVAVKRLKEKHSQDRDTQFQRELQLTDLTFHRNLLKLRGFCSTSKERLFVYPYMVNGSVASRLGGIASRDAQTPLDWATRKQIAKGAARGLAYLHENCHQKIIHRNFKSANILLDENFEAVVCDFGLAKLMDYRGTHVNTIVCGTFAHIPPEYLSAGIVSEKTDVFGYGIMLLELISGQGVSYLSGVADAEDGMLLNWVKGLLRMRKLALLVDSNIQREYVDIELEQFVQVALLCTQVVATKRPAMSKVVGMLEGEGLAGRWEELQKDDMLRQRVPLGLEASLISSEEVHFGQLKRFSMKELQIATDNFSNKNILGRGGFGKVYKGRLPDGSLIAVKRLKEKFTAGGLAQFKSEVEMIMAIHRNLLKLRGLCSTQTERLLVYPYMANGSLASCLRERADSRPPLGWPTRKQIALGAARGLAYLHEHCNPKIVHRDVKAANILLDEDFEAAVGDFGLAKLLDDRDTHVTTAVRGTIGHIAPEYLSTGKASEKTDVFGYGVMLLEMITGQRAFDLARLANDDDIMLLDWVKGHLRDQRLGRLLDPDLQGNYNEEEFERMTVLALLCTQSNPFERPTMSKVVRMLEGGCSAERWKELREMLEASNQPLPLSNSALISRNSNSIEELSGPR